MKLSKNSDNASRFAKAIRSTKQGKVAEKVEFPIDMNGIHNEEKYDSFYDIVSNLKDDVSQIIKINERRWEVETHFLICFTTMTIFKNPRHEIERSR